MFKSNRVTELFKIKYPILQGGMAWVADADLAAAVSNGGGLGVIAAANMPPELLEIQLKRIQSLTNKPYAVNIMLMSPTADEVIELVAAYRVPIVTTGAGMPGKVLDRLKPLGTIVVPVIASIAHAERVVKHGADAVIAEGTEAGGHIGEITTMVLVPQVSDAVSVPVIAAGGIADGRGVAAAFALGAEGVQVGTRFLCATECNAHDNYKQKVLSIKDRATIVTGRSLGHPVRSLKNRFTQQFQDMESSNVTKEELEKFGAGRLRNAVVDGDVEMGSVMAGQVAGLVNSILPAAEIIEEIFSEAKEIGAKVEKAFL